jgi:hypothetical protein
MTQDMTFPPLSSPLLPSPSPPFTFLSFPFFLLSSLPLFLPSPIFFLWNVGTFIQNFVGGQKESYTILFYLNYEELKGIKNS